MSILPQAIFSALALFAEAVNKRWGYDYNSKLQYVYSYLYKAMPSDLVVSTPWTALVDITSLP